MVTADRDEKIRISHYPNSYNIHSYLMAHKEYGDLNFIFWMLKILCLKWLIQSFIKEIQFLTIDDQKYGILMVNL